MFTMNLQFRIQIFYVRVVEMEIIKTNLKGIIIACNLLL